MSTTRTDIDRHIAHVTLNRPDVLNALNAQMAVDLGATVSALADNEAVRCVVLSGAGDGFMAGGDIGFFKQSLPELSRGETQRLAPLFDDVHAIVRGLRTMRKPVLASVHGAVAGFGVSLMAACDLVIAAENTVFTLAYCHLGTSPDGGSTYALPRMMGAKQAMELALLGERFDAGRAQSLGLVNWVVPERALQDKTRELSARLAAGPTFAYGQTKSLLHQSLESSLEAQLEAERDSFIECATTADFAEGVNAFLAKRKPRF
ncbi:MAG: enoyl-CoA hydratase-related protein [Gammaproteobacteria bacterium]|nr:enoyl-CoA hydratase-related protein [Gammaproteobacteria bacterium]